MSCPGGCNDHASDDPTHPPCASCLAARMLPPKMVPAVMSGVRRVGAAADDVTTLQRFLQQLTSTETFPTASELQAAQQAVTNLSTEVPGMQGSPTTPTTPSGGGSSVTTSPAGVILMVAGAALVGGGVVYLGVTKRKRKKRR